MGVNSRLFRRRSPSATTQAGRPGHSGGHGHPRPPELVRQSLAEDVEGEVERVDQVQAVRPRVGVDLHRAARVIRDLNSATREFNQDRLPVYQDNL